MKVLHVESNQSNLQINEHRKKSEHQGRRSSVARILSDFNISTFHTRAYLRSRAEHVRDREAAAGRIRTSRAIDIFIHRQRDIKISISAFIDLHHITTNMKSSGARTSERLARKRQRLDEEEKKASAAGGHSVRSGSTGTFRPKIGGRPIAMDCGILPSE